MIKVTCSLAGTDSGRVGAVASNGLEQPVKDFGQFDAGVAVDMDIPATATHLLFAATKSNDSYWSGATDQLGLDQHIALKPLPRGPLAWWHSFLNPNGRSTNGGHGIRIGVIDDWLNPQITSQMTPHVLDIGAEAWEPSTDPIPTRPNSMHGHALCSLIGARSQTQDSFSGIAPAAEIVFAGAGTGNGPYLWDEHVANSIDLLCSNKYRCDIIVFSAGDLPDPMLAVHRSLCGAEDEGVLCFTAAGNADGPPLYPACYPEIIAVGGFGQHGSAPDTTYERLLDPPLGVHDEGQEYPWTSSAHGNDVEYVAPAVDIVVSFSENKRAAFTGTSFSAPLCAAVAAVLLSEDGQFAQMDRTIDRVRFARNLLQTKARAIFTSRCRFGTLTL